jgi:hypothetical protein
MKEKALDRLTKWSFILLIAILGTGIFLRIWPGAGFKDAGIDEHNSPLTSTAESNTACSIMAT